MLSWWPDFSLNWLVVVELVFIACMGVLGLISMFMAKQNPDDPVCVFASTFWREFLWPPEVMSIDDGRVERSSDSGGGGRSSRAAREEPTDDDAFYGRVPGGGGGARKVDVVVLVEPHAASDSVVGRDGDGIKIQVVGEAGESRSNKALVEMVANAVGVKPFQVTLTKGHYQTRKTVQIQGLSADDLQLRLSALADVG